VEELAAAERTDRSSRSARSKRPVVIAIATGLLLAAGAGAWALARTQSRQPTFEPPLGAAAPFGIGYVDGFGEHTPKPSPPGKPSRRPPKSPSFSSRPANPQPALLLATSSPGSGESSPPVIEAVAGGLSAVYWATSWNGSYEIYVWVHNDGPDPAQWELTMQLPPNATITKYWEVTGVSLGRDTWQFTSPKGAPLGSGRTYLFAFEGKRGTDAFRVSSCSVNGIACTSFW
jgi:hypothetical protein